MELPLGSLISWVFSFFLYLWLENTKPKKWGQNQMAKPSPGWNSRRYATEPQNRKFFRFLCPTWNLWFTEEWKEIGH